MTRSPTLQPRWRSLPPPPQHPPTQDLQRNIRELQKAQGIEPDPIKLYPAEEDSPDAHAFDRLDPEDILDLEQEWEQQWNSTQQQHVALGKLPPTAAAVPFKPHRADAWAAMGSVAQPTDRDYDDPLDAWRKAFPPPGAGTQGVTGSPVNPLSSTPTKLWAQAAKGLNEPLFEFIEPVKPKPRAAAWWGDDSSLAPLMPNTVQWLQTVQAQRVCGGGAERAFVFEGVFAWVWVCRVCACLAVCRPGPGCVGGQNPHFCGKDSPQGPPTANHQPPTATNR